MRDLSGHTRKPIDRGTLTFWRQESEGPVRTCKETDRPRHTHKLETAEGGTCQDTQGNRQTEVHSRTGDSRARNLSGHARKPTNRGALTNWRWQREGLVRTCKETDRLRHTHSLETAERGTCQDTQGNRQTEVHSLSGDSRGRDLSGHARKPTDRGALTLWRWQMKGLVRTCKETDRPRCTHKLETAERGTCQDMERKLPSEHSHSEEHREKARSGHKKYPRIARG